VIADAVRSLWTAPAPPDAPGPLPRDRALVAVLACTAVLEGWLRPALPWRPVAVLVTVTVILLLPWRRVRPLAVLTVSLGLSILMTVAGSIARVPGEVGLYSTASVLLLAYALFRWARGRDVVIGSVVLLGAYVASVVVDRPPPADMIGGLVVMTLPEVLGLSTRFLATARSRELDQARSRERELLARELHDTVAHHVSAMVVRAQAGRVVAPTRPGAALEALEIIEVEGSRTLAEMRAMVGALRGADEAELAPIGGISDLERLVRPAGDQPGVRVAVRLPDDVSRAVGAALYRIAQESVTNATRHARHARQVDVRVEGRDGWVHLTVRDDGEPVGGGGVTGGYGIIGMAERAKLLGGTLAAGPGPDRGWLVEASLPRTGSGG